MDYGGYPQPGFAPPPSTFGYTMGATQYSPYQQQYTQAGGASLGMSALNFATSTLPGVVGVGATLGGLAGDLLEMGGRTAGTRALGTALSFMDPTAIPLRIGASAAGYGFSAGSALAAGANFGSFGSYVAGGLAGGAAGLGAMALPAAGMYGAYKAGQFGLNNMYQGGLNYIQGQNFASQMAPSVAPGGIATNYSFSSDMRDISRSAGMSSDEISRAARELDAQKLFQTTKDMKEFKEKLGTAMKAVKEIASVTKTSIDDAVKMFGDLRAQGFYNTADIQSQSALTQSRATITGLGLNTTLAVGGMGTQMARQMGLRGRVGSDLAQRNVTGVSLALRSGALSEEEVMEMGGVEAVGLSQTDAQMRFLSSARGRTMIAGMMGAGGKMDPRRIQSVLGGNMTLEDLVTQTAEGGNLRAAGTRAAKEAAAPYAGMAMVQMAMMQQRQIYGGVTAEGTTRMLGTMGLTSQQADALIKTLAQLPDQMRKERTEQENQDNRRKAERLTSQNSFTAQASRYMRPAEEYFQEAGAGLVGAVQGRYTRAMQGLFGGRTYGFDTEMLQAGMSNRNLNLQQPLGDTTGTLFGLNATDRLRRESGGLGKTAAELGLSQDQIQQMIRENKLVNLGGGNTLEMFTQGSLFGEDRYAAAGDLRSMGQQRGIGANALRFTDQTQARLIQLSANKNARALLTQDRDLTYKVLEGVNAFSGGMVSLFGFERRRERAELQTSYETAKRIGLIDNSVSLDQWEKDPRRQAADTSAGSELGSLGSDLGLNLGGGSSAGAVALGNIQQNTKASIDRSLAAIGGQSRSFSETVQAGVSGLGNAMMNFGVGTAPLPGGPSAPLFRYIAMTSGKPLAVPGMMLKGLAASGSMIGELTGGMLGVSREGNKALGTALAEGKNGVRTLYIRFLKLISKGEKDISLGEARELVKLKEDLVRAVGGGDSPAGQEIEAMYSKSRTEGSEGDSYRNTLKEGFERDSAGRPVGTLAMTEDQFQADAVNTNIQALIKQDETIAMGIKDDKVRNAAFDLIQKSGTARNVGEYLDTRKAGLSAILEKMFEGPEGLSAEEVETYGKLTSGSGGAKFAETVKGLVAGGASLKKSDLKAMLGDVSDEDIRKLQSKDPKKILEVMLSKTQMGESFGDELGAGAEIVEGTELEFKKANTQFVQEVKDFITMMDKAGIIPKETTESSSNTVAAD